MKYTEIPRGTYIRYISHFHKDSEIGIREMVQKVFQYNHKDVWVGDTPPYVYTVPWEDIIELCPKETHPEHYL